MGLVDLNDMEFKKICMIMHKKTGVFLKDSKKPLVTTRLRKRLEVLGLSSYKEYIAILEQPASKELEFFINAITTNETYLFRHIKQFDYLRDNILPEFLQKKITPVTIWSAAASTGEEPYSIAITCNEFYEKNRTFNYKLYATDVNSDVIAFARDAIYTERSFRETPKEFQTKYFTSSKSDGVITKTLYSVAPKIKTKVIFGQHNLLESFKMASGINIVFLRNVMIYFEKDIKEKVVSLIYEKMAVGGYIFISLSESLNDIKTKFEFVKSGIYKKV